MGGRVLHIISLMSHVHVDVMSLEPSRIPSCAHRCRHRHPRLTLSWLSPSHAEQPPSDDAALPTSDSAALSELHSAVTSARNSAALSEVGSAASSEGGCSAWEGDSQDSVRRGCL